MHLLLGQLIYTSFAERGLRILTSPQVPKEIQQTLVEGIASKHWDSYRPPKIGYRAVYLHQATLEQTLFGWFYNDGADDVGRIHVPYLICYYLAEPLLASQLETIFTCLHKGPLALVNRHNPPTALEPLIISDLSYQPARPGVKIPISVCRYSHTALKQEQLLDLFIPVDEEMATERNKQSYKQVHKQRRADSLGTPDPAAEMDTVDPIEAATETETTQSHQGYQEKLQEYESAFVEAVQRQYPLSNSTRDLLEALQQTWQLREEDTKLIESRIIQQRKALQPLKKAIETTKRGVAHRNIQSLLGLGIAVTVLALASSIYGLLQGSIFTSNNSTTISSTGSLTYKTFFGEVSNVPQGLFPYGGSTTFAPLRFTALASAMNQAHPQFQLRYTQPVGINPGSSTGIKMLLAGELSFAQSSRPLKDIELTQAKERGFTLEQVPIAVDGIAFYVNPQMSIPGLSLSQLRDIFTGKITNWKVVGGPDEPITPFSRDPQTSGTVDFIKEEVLGEKELSSSVVQVKNTTESIRKVAETRGGIGYATASEVVDQNTIYPLPLSGGAGQAFVSPLTELTGANQTKVNKTAFAIGSYPLTRRLFVIIKRDGRLDEQAGTAYVNLLLTDAGQRLVEQAGFVSIH